MNLFKCMPIDNMNVFENKDNVLLLTEKGVMTKNVYAVFDGDLSYDKEKEAFKLASDAGFVAWYKEVSGMIQSPSKMPVVGGTPCMRTMNIPLKGLYQVKGVYFWLEKGGKIIDPIPYLLQKDDTEAEPPKKKVADKVIAPKKKVAKTGKKPVANRNKAKEE